MNIRLEYIWLDGSSPTQKLRSKTKILQRSPEFRATPDNIPQWSFDGSSTQQAEGHSSDCILEPVAVYRDPLSSGHSWLVMCEVLVPGESGWGSKSPHTSNTRALIHNDNSEYWFGFEQEYFILDAYSKEPLTTVMDSNPPKSGEYYCGIGERSIAGRNIVEEHLSLCLAAGLHITGINAEVAPSQWEYQLLGKGAKSASDDLWISRYLLERLSEKHQIIIEWHPKPFENENGSGCHINFSNASMRNNIKSTNANEELFKAICYQFGKEENIQKALDVYGAHNDKRLTGKHETQAIDKFSYGIGDRGASIRIPLMVAENGYIGYLEDRRPASNVDPYKATQLILEVFDYMG